MEQELVTIENIEKRIYEIRGVQVMLDSDLAKLYHVETKRLIQAVKRNIKRFPESFMFKLTNIEHNNLRSQIVTSSLNNNYGGRRYNPYVFTEQGVAMLSSILRSDIAINTIIVIINAFVKMRHFLGNGLIDQRIINNQVLKNTDDIKLLKETFNKMNQDIKIDEIIFDGHIYDAYSLFMKILNKSKKEIIIIDNYAGRELLDLLKDINQKIIIVSSNINEDTKIKYLEQYNNISFINNKSFHDRFIIIDRKKLYSCGSSFKDLGNKCFTIHEHDNHYIKEITDKIL